MTLTGTGGIGKSRLARRVAQRLVSAYEGVVRWVDLTPLSSSGLVAPTILAAFGRRELPGHPPVETLIRALARAGHEP